MSDLEGSQSESELSAEGAKDLSYVQALQELGESLYDEMPEDHKDTENTPGHLQMLFNMMSHFCGSTSNL